MFSIIRKEENVMQAFIRDSETLLHLYCFGLKNLEQDSLFIANFGGQRMHGIH